MERVNEAVGLLVRETDNELFKSLSKNLQMNESVRELLYDVLILSNRRNFSTIVSAVSLAFRYNYIFDNNGAVAISNRIFEIVMTSYFISLDEQQPNRKLTHSYSAQITENGRFNMELCLERFLIHWQEIYNEKDAKFLEHQCRIIFLTYLKPLLNGIGFSFIETSLSDDRRMDIIVIYNQERFILELKTWKGQLYNEEGVGQLLGYMKKLETQKGYLLTFDFRKNPETFKASWRSENGHDIFEARVYKETT